MGGLAGTLLTTLVHHSDYVTSLACSPNSSLVATAGLRGELFLVDMEVRLDESIIVRNRWHRY